MLEVRNIKKAFGECVANEDVSLTVQKGTIHAIVGENGAGEIDDHEDRLRVLSA